MSCMTTTISRPRRGDRYRLNRPRGLVYIEVIRSARDGTWADLRYHTSRCTWSERRPLPLPARAVRCAWTDRDIRAPYRRIETVDLPAADCA